MQLHHKPGKHLPYFLLVVNLVSLTTLLWAWTDRFEHIINPGVRFDEFIKIFGITCLALLGTRLMRGIFKMSITKYTTRWVLLFSGFILLTTAYWYISYIQKIIDHRLRNGEFRDGIASKIVPPKNGGEGLRGVNLSAEEYYAIANHLRLVTIPNTATSITYDFSYDSFLGDYSFTLDYYLPKDDTIKSFEINRGAFTKWQSVTTDSNRLRVQYMEIQR